jgi:hypothetical protein
MPKLTNRAGEVFLHPACLDAGQESALNSNILVYHEIVKTAKVYVLLVCGAVPSGKGCSRRLHCLCVVQFVGNKG